MPRENLDHLRNKGALLLHEKRTWHINVFQIPEQHLYYHDEIGISFRELKQHYHMPSHSLNE